MSNLLHLAKREAFERVPETCPAVHTESIEAIGALHLWFQKRPWFSTLSDKEAGRIELRVGEFVADLLEASKEHGARPLREALVASIHEHMAISFSPAQVAAVELGEDPWALQSCTTAKDSVICQAA